MFSHDFFVLLCLQLFTVYCFILLATKLNYALENLSHHFGQKYQVPTPIFSRNGSIVSKGWKNQCCQELPIGSHVLFLHLHAKYSCWPLMIFYHLIQCSILIAKIWIRGQALGTIVRLLLCDGWLGSKSLEIAFVLSGSNKSIWLF